MAFSFLYHWSNSFTWTILSYLVTSCSSLSFSTHVAYPEKSSPTESCLALFHSPSCCSLLLLLLLTHSVLSNSLLPHGLQHARLPSPSPACSNSCPSSWWCHPTISSPVVSFSSCLQSFPASVFSSESVLRIRSPKWWSFTSASVFPMNIQDWFPLPIISIGFWISVPILL